MKSILSLALSYGWMFLGCWTAIHFGLWKGFAAGVCGTLITAMYAIVVEAEAKKDKSRI